MMVNNSDEELLELSEYFSTHPLYNTHYVALYFFCISGIIGNLLCFFVLFRMKIKSSINICLQFLAAFDTLLLTCILVDTLSTDLPGMRWVHSLEWIAWTGSIGATVGVTLERYIAVCHPLRAKYLCDKRRTVIFNLLIVLFAVCFNIPRICLVPEISWKGGSTEFSLYLYRRYGQKSLPHLPPWFFQSKVYMELCYVWLDMALIAVPLLFLSALYINIFLAARKATKIRREMSHHHRAEIGLSKMVFGVIVIFFICYIPPLIFKISSCGGFVPLDLHLKISFLCDVLAAANSAMNFVIYSALTKEFRKTFMKTFCSCIRKRKMVQRTLHEKNHTSAATLY